MSSANKLVKQLTAQWITPESFQRYGQVIHASRDGKSYDSTEAQARTDNGIPRFTLFFTTEAVNFTITRHVQCTQCLGSLEGKSG